MSKPTKEEKLSAYQTILYAIRFDLTEDRMWDMYSAGKKQIIETEIARLETMCEKLLAPKQPKPSRKQETAHVAIVIPVPSTLTTSSNAILKRGKR